MQLTSLLERMKMEHPALESDTLREQASKRELGYRDFLSKALSAEWKRDWSGIAQRAPTRSRVWPRCRRATA